MCAHTKRMSWVIAMTKEQYSVIDKLIDDQ